jgi:hypothetical protein
MANAYQPTYDDLVLEIQDICENTNSEFVGNLPRFVHRAQDQLQRDLGLDFWRDYYNDTLIAASYTRQPEWLIVRSIYLPSINRFLLKRDLDYVRIYGGSAGVPKVWAEDQTTDSANTLLIAPAPSPSISAKIEYMKRLNPLTSLNPTNWLTLNVGDLLLLLALANAFTYDVAPERAQACLQLYQQTLPGVLNELRDSERMRDIPIRQAARPAVGPGSTA